LPVAGNEVDYIQIFCINSLLALGTDVKLITLWRCHGCKISNVTVGCRYICARFYSKVLCNRSLPTSRYTGIYPDCVNWSSQF
jgi:hypothetical protein